MFRRDRGKGEENKSHSGLPKEVIKKIQRIHIHTNYLVNDVLAGEYESAFRGRGMEFEEVREYHAGDDVRDIDWNVTARMGHPYVKIYREERELTIMLMVDVSNSGQFGSVKQLKNEVAAEIAAILAFAAVKSDDKVGLIIFSDIVEKFIPPKKGRNHVWRVIREVIQHRPQGKKTDINIVLDFLNKITTRRVIAFLISDFIAQGYDKSLRITNKKHDVIAISITDPRERELPKVGFIELEDAETGEVMLVDTNDGNIRKGFSKLAAKNVKETLERFRNSNVDHIGIYTDQPYIDPIMKFFRIREKRL
ncbi:MAG: DUF58 domain-containing protein [Deltaproteobacteria bacterium]|nr:DUF58 domain-containing protein [Deltaproteobacteria bacterium]